MITRLLKIIILVTILFFSRASSSAYSVLTHEAIIDACWDKSILPLLKQKYPASTADQLKEAHAYVYGGAISPDMGYYPFGSKLFTNLLHYVRSGDFIEALLNEAQGLDEYAFALGVLCHYNADVYGHALGVNVSVPIVYPKVKKKYGDIVTYEEDKISHLRMEFGFDVLQTARGNYASTNYHDFIGFKVSTSILQRAFMRTYGLDIHSVFHNMSLATGTFKWTVKDFFPLITKAAWASKRNDILKTAPTQTSRNFIYKMHRVNYYQDFGKNSRPGFLAGVLSGLIKILPKIGPLRALKFKTPGPEAEKLFIRSFDTVVARYTATLGKLYSGEVWLANKDFDTGNETVEGEYRLADKSYGQLVLKLEHDNFDSLNTALKQNILLFFDHPGTIAPSKKNRRKQKNILHALSELKAISPGYTSLSMSYYGKR